jgi:hypothetical protein
MPLAQFQKSLNDVLGLTARTVFDLAFVQRMLREIENRIAPLEADADRVEQAVQDVRNIALTRINDVLTPAIENILDLEQRGFLRAISATPATLVAGEIRTLEVIEADRAIFSPSSFVALTRTTTLNDYAICRNAGWDSATGTLVLELITVEGNPGPFSDWEISALAGPTIAQITLLAESVAAAEAATGAAEAVAQNALAAQQAATAANLALNAINAKITISSAMPSGGSDGDIWFRTN